MVDLSSKAQYIAELLRQKEELEEEMAPHGAFPCVGSTLIKITTELKVDVRSFVRQKRRMMELLEQMLVKFESNNETVREQILSTSRGPQTEFQSNPGS